MSRRVRNNRTKRPRLLKPGDTIYIHNQTHHYLERYVGIGKSVVIKEIRPGCYREDDIHLLVEFGHGRKTYRVDRFCRRPGGPPLTEKDFHV